MKGKWIKATTILLVLIISLSLSACDATDFWGYFTGNFPDIPEEPPQEITINQGTISTQTGGLADVIEKIRPSVVDLEVVYHYNQAFVIGKTYKKTYSEIAVTCKVDEDGVYLIATHQGTKDGANITVSGSPYVFSRVEIFLAIGTKRVRAQKVISIEDADTALLFVDKESLGDRYEDMVAVAFPEVYQPIKGSTVIAFSNPYGVYSGTVTKGIVSSEREVEVDDKVYTLLQTDAALSFMSSGIVFNDSGELMGALFAKASGDYEGLSFAMPVDQIIASYHQKGLLTDIEVGENEDE